MGYSPQWKWKSLSQAQLLCPKDYTIHGILQVRILEWVAVPFSRGASQPRDQTQVSRIAGRFFISWATRESLTSHVIPTWQIEGEMVEAVTDFLILGSNITADGNCSHEIRWLLLGRKAMTNLDSVLKTRDITLPTIVCSPGCGLPSGHKRLWERDGKKGRAPRNWCFQTVVLEKMPESSLNSKESKSVNLNGNQPWILIERIDLNLKLQYFGHLMWTANSSERSLMLGKIEGRRRKGIRGWDGWKAPPIQWIWTWANFGRWWGTGGLVCCSSWGCRARHDWVIEKQQQSYFLEFLKSDLSIFSFLTLCFMSHLERACPFLLAFFNFLC